MEGEWKGSLEKKRQWYERCSWISPLLDSSFGSLERYFMLDTPPDVAYQSMQLEGANLVLQ